MFQRTISCLIALALVTGCAEPVTSSLSPRGIGASAARSPGATDPTATWKIPLADAGLGLRSDRQFGDGTSSVYADGICGIAAKIFATTSASNSGDATINTGAPKGGKCGRRFVLQYPDGYTETVASFNNLHVLQNTHFSIQIGTAVNRRLVVNPGVLTNNPSRCGRLIFGPNTTTGAGSDSVRVTRIDGRTWHIESQSAELSRAHCEITGQVFSMPVDLVIVASRDLP